MLIKKGRLMRNLNPINYVSSTIHASDVDRVLEQAGNYLAPPHDLKIEEIILQQKYREIKFLL